MKGNRLFDLETQAWMCKNFVATTTTRIVKLADDWTMFNGLLHHDTCPAIANGKVKGAWSFPTILSVCSCCGVEIPEGILMIAKLQMMKPRHERHPNKRDLLAIMYGAKDAAISKDLYDLYKK